MRARFFDAYQDRRIDLLAEIYAPDCVVWHNVYGKETTGQQNLAALPASCEIQRRRTYNDRIINTFDVCFIGYVRDGKISRAYEYVDTGQLDKFLGPR